jgi:hypothetical protein
MPIFANIITTVIILRILLYNDKSFSKWYKNHLKISIILTVLTVIDIEIFNTFFSQVAVFDAPITERMQNYIVWCCVYQLIIKNIPFLIFQVCNPLSFF